MADLGYPMVVKKLSDEDGGGYLAMAPDLVGCMGDGDTPEAAVEDLTRAIGEWVDEASRLKQNIPAPNSVVTKAKDEWASLKVLVRAQEALIGQQEVALAAARAEIDQIRERINNLLESERGEISFNWLSHSGVGSAAVVKRRNRNLPN